MKLVARIIVGAAYIAGALMLFNFGWINLNDSLQLDPVHSVYVLIAALAAAYFGARAVARQSRFVGPVTGLLPSVVLGVFLFASVLMQSDSLIEKIALGYIAFSCVCVSMFAARVGDRKPVN